MERPLIRYFDIGEWLQAAMKSRHLVSREVGRQVREAIEEQLRTTAEGAVTTLDFAGVEHLDYTVADECLVKLISRVQMMEYGNLYLVLAGLTPTAEENIDMALKRKHLATLIQRKDGPYVIGHLNPYLYSAFLYVRALKVCTARELTDDSDNDDLSLASTKLLNLHKARLVQRTNESLADGGWQYIYRLVEGSVVPDSPQRRSGRGKL